MGFINDLLAKLKLANERVNFIDEVTISENINDRYGLLNIHLLNPTKVINLCGGVPAPNLDKLDLYIESSCSDSIDVEINTSLYSSSNTIFLNDRFITNNSFIIHKHKLRRAGVGTRRIINQVVTAKKLGFLKIETYARGGIDNSHHHQYNGHYTWARLGFDMVEDDVFRFRATMIEWMRPEKTIHELLSSEGGKKKWKYEGHGWSGYFDLTTNSPCLKRLEKYLIEKGIRHTL
jgi:hypothetical protein